MLQRCSRDVGSTVVALLLLPFLPGRSIALGPKSAAELEKPGQGGNGGPCRPWAFEGGGGGGGGGLLFFPSARRRAAFFLDLAGVPLSYVHFQTKKE